jgi:hypothetical protein
MENIIDSKILRDIIYVAYITVTLVIHRSFSYDFGWGKALKVAPWPGSVMKPYISVPENVASLHNWWFEGATFWFWASEA